MGNLLLLLTASVTLADFDSANLVYENGDYPTALREFTKLANAGVPAAQYNLAFMFYGGEGVVQDYSKAFYWFEKAAKSGYARAQDILGYMYSHGYGVPANRVRAYAWYSLAAENGVFLAGKVRDSLASEMGKAERIEANLLTREYLHAFLHKPSTQD